MSNGRNCSRLPGPVLVPRGLPLRRDLRTSLAQCGDWTPGTTPPPGRPGPGTSSGQGSTLQVAAVTTRACAAWRGQSTVPTPQVCPRGPHPTSRPLLPGKSTLLSPFLEPSGAAAARGRTLPSVHPCSFSGPAVNTELRKLNNVDLWPRPFPVCGFVQRAEDREGPSGVRAARAERHKTSFTFPAARWPGSFLESPLSLGRGCLSF